MSSFECHSNKAKKCVEKFESNKQKYQEIADEIRAGPLDTVTDRIFFYNDRKQRFHTLFEKLCDLNYKLTELRRKGECIYNPSMIIEIYSTNEEIFKMIADKIQLLTKADDSSTSFSDPALNTASKYLTETPKTHFSKGEKFDSDDSEDQSDEDIDINHKDCEISLYVYHSDKFLKTIRSIQEFMDGEYLSVEQIMSKKQLIQDRNKIVRDSFLSLHTIKQNKVKGSKYDLYQIEEHAVSLMDTLSDLARQVTKSERLEQETNSTSFQTGSASFYQKFDLPIIPIPDFEGDCLLWPNFELLFTRRVINAKGLDDDDKLMYLQECIKKDAKKFMGNIVIGLHNFEEMWNKLKTEYTHKRAVVDSITDKLFNIPAPQAGSVKDLQEFYSGVKGNIESFGNQGILMGSFEPVVARLLFVKLDETTKQLFEMALEDERACLKVDQILNFVLKRINACKHKVSKESISSSPNFQKTISCSKCDGSHYLNQCDLYKRMSVNERIQFIKANNLCSNCLKITHGECRYSVCKVCEGNHHTTIHFNKTESGDFKKMNPSNQGKGKSPNSTSHNVVDNANNKFVFLGTAEVVIENCLGEKVKCRALLDPGSQVNVISKGLVQKLGLKGDHKTGKISGIGARDITSAQKIFVNMTGHRRKYNTRLEATILPQITKYLPNEEELRLSPYVKKQLADKKYYQPDSIDLLIGGGVWTDILIPKIKRLGKNRPLLQCTKLGYVVMGSIKSKMISEVCNIICNEENFNEGSLKLLELGQMPKIEPLLLVNEQIPRQIFSVNTEANKNGQIVFSFAKETECLPNDQFALPSQHSTACPILSSPEDKHVETIIREPHFKKYVNHKKINNCFKRIVAHVSRVVRNCKFKEVRKSKIKKHLKTKEFQSKDFNFIRKIQTFHNLTEKIDKIYKNLSFFTDDQGIIRVGGRLKHSDLPFDSKHPKRMSNCEFSRLLIRSLHLLNLLNSHSILQTRSKLWIERDKRLKTKDFRDCIRCCRKLRGFFTNHNRDVSLLNSEQEAEWSNIPALQLELVLVLKKIQGKIRFGIVAKIKTRKGEPLKEIAKISHFPKDEEVEIISNR